MGDDVVADVRRFNRYWTQVLGLLDEGLLETEHPLPEARVLFELAQRPVVERVELRALLGIDDSFFSRLLQRLAAQGPRRHRDVAQRRPPAGRPPDARRPRRGPPARCPLGRPDRRADRTLDAGERRRLAAAMDEIEQLTTRTARDAAVVLRDPEPGDLGWVAARHGALYAAEHGWNTDFEALVARIVADFHDELEPGRERAWIADVGGRRAGCVFAKQRDDTTAQLRLLLVEPWARGLGLGRRLVDTCLDFARHAGYGSIMLWTNDVLVAARRIYEAVGFELVEEEPHHSFGHDLVGQIWRRDL